MERKLAPTSGWVELSYSQNQEELSNSRILKPSVHISSTWCSLESWSFYPVAPGTCSYHPARTNCVHLFPALQSAQWWLEIGHGRNIYTTEIGKAISQGFFSPRLLVIKHIPAHCCSYLQLFTHAWLSFMLLPASWAYVEPWELESFSEERGSALPLFQVPPFPGTYLHGLYFTICQALF